ncbi:MAG: P-II family nitrogen regulator [Clostridiales Family XIII bacterium]|jgi:Amt family ammonium transporter|nr:P-II family nitrogen regulator [Clostridiales Family XIII bacterium]
MGAEMYKVSVVTRREKLLTLMAALEAIGVAAMTVTQVDGCGTQLGQMEQYRGVKEEIHCLPKIMVEAVVSTVPVDDVVRTAREALCTGNIGDGKIFVSRVSRVVRVRTGEENLAALVNK